MIIGMDDNIKNITNIMQKMLLSAKVYKWLLTFPKTDTKIEAKYVELTCKTGNFYHYKTFEKRYAFIRILGKSYIHPAYGLHTSHCTQADSALFMPEGH